MARVQNTLIGKSSGSVGGATFSTWKGVNVLKSKAISVANPQTVPQMLQRAKMTLMVALFRLSSSVVQIGYKTLAVQQSAYNAFIKQNIVNATSGSTALNAAVVYPDVLMAKGTIGVIPIDTVAGTNASANVPVTWDDALAPVGSTPNDLAYVVVVNETQGVAGFASLPTLRSTGTITAVMPTPVVTADVLHAYLFFKSDSSAEVSDSAYETDVV